MKICPTCKTEFPDTEDFCLGDGTELVAAGAAPAQGTITTAAAKTAARTLQFGKQIIPLYEGQQFTIGRPEGSNNPSLPIDEESVSATLLVLTVTNGQLVAGYVADNEKPYDIQKKLKPGEQMEVNPGEIIWAGNNPIVVV